MREGQISGADFVSAFLLAAEQPAQENSFDTSVSNRSSEVSGVQSTPTLSSSLFFLIFDFFFWSSLTLKKKKNRRPTASNRRTTEIT